MLLANINKSKMPHYLMRNPIFDKQPCNYSENIRFMMKSQRDCNRNFPVDLPLIQLKMNY